MPSTAVYLVLPSRMARIAASLMFSGVSKSGSPAPRPITSRPAAFELARLVRHRDGGGGLDAGEAVGEEGHFEAPRRRVLRRGTLVAMPHQGKSRAKAAEARHAARQRDLTFGRARAWLSSRQSGNAPGEGHADQATSRLGDRGARGDAGIRSSSTAAPSSPRPASAPPRRCCRGRRGRRTPIRAPASIRPSPIRSLHDRASGDAGRGQPPLQQLL